VLRQELQGVPIMALTATASTRVQDDICQQLRLRNPQRLVSTFNRPNISYEGWLFGWLGGGRVPQSLAAF
jgi:ATP-dependent DNA helicase RecQ